MTNQRLILVSNRLPFRMSEKEGKIQFSASGGGLVSSIKSYIHKTNELKADNDPLPLWIGTSDIPEKKMKETIREGIIVHEGFELSPVFIAASLHDKFYNGFCNDIIWPLFHYFPSYAKFSDDHYAEYAEVNRIFCDKIVESYKPNDIIWIHDYHLMLLPSMVRKRLPDATVGFFLHIPFPSFELFRLLPSKWRKEILQGLLGADLIGFHTNDYVQHFLQSIRQILGYDNILRSVTTQERNITVDTFPISIDYNKFHKASNDSDTFIERNKIKKKLYGNQLIVSVDRLDYAKGLINRLNSYELFLEKHPQCRKKVTYLFQVVPSRDIIAKYKETKKEIEGIVSRINGKYGSIEWTPILYQYKSLEFKKLVSLYMAADVALITPMRDGMNLVAKEFVASRTDKRGVLILSETAGAASELGEALFVNPTDRQEIAEAISTALVMTVEEQMERNETMQKRLQEYDIIKWAEDFLSQLNLQKSKQQNLKIKQLSLHVVDELTIKFTAAKSRLILLDYDGTLTPLASLPHLAVPSDELLLFLNALASDPKNEIVIISGRPMHSLDKWFGNIPLNLVAEHGAFYKRKHTDWLQSLPVSSGWKPSVLQIMNQFTERCQGTFLEEKELSLAWHYRNAEKELGFLRSRELINALLEQSSHLNFQIIEGHKVIETRARGIDKGLAAKAWIRQKTYEFILAIGDDKTDEDLFRAIPATQYTIRVGLTQSLAKYNLKRQKDVLILLKKLQVAGSQINTQLCE